jgi:hypothetical protein
MQRFQEYREELVTDRPELASEYFSYATDSKLASAKKGR